jgi:hypothetical protein
LRDEHEGGARSLRKRGVGTGTRRGLRLARGPRRMEEVMSTTMWIVLIVVMFVMFGGGGGYYWSRGRR